MNLTLPQLVVGTAGAILIYSAVKNASPVTVIKNALEGKTTVNGKAVEPQLPVFSEDGTGLGPALGVPYNEAPSGGNPVGLPPIPGLTPLTSSAPFGAGAWRDPSAGKLTT